MTDQIKHWQRSALLSFSSFTMPKVQAPSSQADGRTVSVLWHILPFKSQGEVGLLRAWLPFVSTKSPTVHSEIWQQTVTYLQTWEILLFTSALLQLNGPRLHLWATWGDSAQPTSVAHTGLETASWDPQSQALCLNREKMQQDTLTWLEPGSQEDLHI